MRIILVGGGAIVVALLDLFRYGFHGIAYDSLVESLAMEEGLTSAKSRP